MPPQSEEFCLLSKLTQISVLISAKDKKTEQKMSRMVFVMAMLRNLCVKNPRMSFSASHQRGWQTALKKISKSYDYL